MKITGVVPVRPGYRPDIGEIYDVTRIYENTLKEKVFYINVKGAPVCVRENECEVVKE